MRRRSFLQLCLSTPLWAYETPQIWRLSGASLSDQRLDIENKLGPASLQRPLKASFLGETWEYHYSNGLIAAFRDRDLGRHPRLLIGTQLTSRGEHFLSQGMSRAQVERRMEGSPQDGLYRDEARLAYLSLRFVQDQLQQIVLARPPGLPEKGLPPG